MKSQRNLIVRSHDFKAGQQAIKLRQSLWCSMISSDHRHHIADVNQINYIQNAQQESESQNKFSAIKSANDSCRSKALQLNETQIFTGQTRVTFYSKPRLSNVYRVTFHDQRQWERYKCEMVFLSICSLFFVTRNSRLFSVQNPIPSIPSEELMEYLYELFSEI